MKFRSMIGIKLNAIVTPLAGVWIEILRLFDAISPPILSLPLRECGLKFLLALIYQNIIHVTPLAGVWIEICQNR